MPRKVTDKETMRKLKAEFPQLELPVDAQAHTATHANYAGRRSAFEWGSVEAAAATVASEGAGVALAPTPAAAAPARARNATSALSTNGAATGSTATNSKAASAAYSWGPLPSDAGLQTAAPVPPPPNAPPVPTAAGSEGGPAGVAAERSAAGHSAVASTAAAAESIASTAASMADVKYSWGPIPPG